MPVRMAFSALSEPTGFRADSRYSMLPGAMVERQAPPEMVEEAAPHDPIADAFTQGFSAGVDQAMAEFSKAAAANDLSREKLGLSFARMDKALEEELRLRLRDTVAALCEAAIMPMAFDEDMLVLRISRAVAMLARADDDRVIHLHPDDLELVSPRLSAEWDVQPDASLERGELRVDCGSGGVEDGPATWRRAIAEALHQC